MPISDIMNSGDLKRRVDALEKRLREITSGRRLEDASVGARGIQIIGGGNLTVDGGTVRLISNLGVTLAKYGPNSLGNPEWRLNYDSGGAAVNVQGGANDQFVAVWDRGGHIVFSTDTDSGAGLARPWLPLRLVPAGDAQIEPPSPLPSTDATSASVLWEGINSIFHPKITVGVNLSTLGGTGHWSMDINGESVVGDATGDGIRTVNVPGWGDDIRPGDVISINVYGWVDPGPGRVWMQVDRIYAEQS